MDNEFLVFLDGVRDVYGKPLIVTSDARTIAEEQALPGHAEPPQSSLHVADPVNAIWARAFDLRWIPDAAARFRLVTAILQVSAGRPIELEFVPPWTIEVNTYKLHPTCCVAWELERRNV